MNTAEQGKHWEKQRVCANTRKYPTITFLAFNCFSQCHIPKVFPSPPAQEVSKLTQRKHKKDHFTL